MIAHALVGWMLCSATIGIGKTMLSMQLTLIVHVILAPIFFAIIAFVYFKMFNYTSPLMTAAVFLTIVMVLDAGLVAPVIERNYDMFRSTLGTWIPFLLFFLSVYIVGLKLKRLHITK